MNRNLFLIFLLSLLSLVIALPKNLPVNFTLSLPNGFSKTFDFVISSPELHLEKPLEFDRDLNLKLGLDLQGGTEVILRADMSEIDSESREDALASAREVIARRVDLYGVSEPVIKTVTTKDDYRISVALPGVDDPQEALDLIGQTARLEFRELPESATASATFADFTPTGLSGSDLEKSTVQFDPQSGAPVVGLEFNDEGASKFAEITDRNVGEPLAIFLDGFPISSPIVQARIDGGSAVINGDFTLEDAQNLVVTLNAGALPVPITVISQNNVAPSLGAASVEESVRAGLIGLAAVALFMILLYGWLGFVADLGLVIYGLLTLAIYKLIPVTITLPGLAGFILSIGMAVDANILIFERMKEELRKGNSWQDSLELGFGRAWDSIKDANLATIITTLILFNPLDWSFLNTSGLVRGFALTLFLGVVISLFTGVFVTRNLLRAFTKGTHAN